MAVVGQGVDGGADVRPRRLDAEAQDLGHQILTAVEVVVEAAGLHVGQFGDVGQAGVGVALLAEDPGGGVQDALSRALGLGQPLGHRDDDATSPGRSVS